MFTLEQNIFIVQCYFTNGERLENGEWSYSTPRVFEKFQQKFPDFHGTYHTNNLPWLFRFSIFEKKTGLAQFPN
jgi:hypothetical protein